MPNGLSADDRRDIEVELAWAQHTPSVVAHLRKALKARLSAEQNHRCCWCGARTTDHPGPLQCTIEHIVPRSMGGRTNYSNLAMACRTCNSTRGNNLFFRGLAWGLEMQRDA